MFEIKKKVTAYEQEYDELCLKELEQEVNAIEQQQVIQNESRNDSP